MNSDVKAAIECLTTYGYCLLEDRIPEETAYRMAERFLELHGDAKCQIYNTGDQYYQTLFGMMNLDDRVWMCASHPDTVAIARHFLGGKLSGGRGVFQADLARCAWAASTR